MCIFCLVIWYLCNVSEMATVKVHATLGKQSGLHWNLIEVNCVWNIWCRNKTPYVLWERGAAYLALVLLSKHVCSLYQFEIIQVWLLPSHSSWPELRETRWAPCTLSTPSWATDCFEWELVIISYKSPTFQENIINHGYFFFLSSSFLFFVWRHLRCFPFTFFFCYLMGFFWCKLQTLEVHIRTRSLGLLVFDPLPYTTRK